jgi:hypothetical protein
MTECGGNASTQIICCEGMMEHAIMKTFCSLEGIFCRLKFDAACPIPLAEVLLLQPCGHAKVGSTFMHDLPLSRRELLAKVRFPLLAVSPQ